MNFDPNAYQLLTITENGRPFTCRAFTGISYCDRPALPDFQVMNIFVPEDYYAGEAINGYTLATAPVFFPNSVGGYMPGAVETPDKKPWGEGLNTIFYALKRGYVCVSAGIRGSIQKNAAGENVGKAPALLVDYKAAVRYLKKFSDVLPGDENKIITNGTSAGGALSSLIGATGNHPDYAPLLAEIGAADADDSIFGASCYCPITNLDHADMAYDWEFRGIHEYKRLNMRMDESGRPQLSAEDRAFTEEECRISEELADLFPAYLNSLGLKSADGRAMTLDADGNGSFKDYVEAQVLASANRQMKEHVAEKYADEPSPCGQPEEKAWLTIENGTAVAMDFHGWAEEITRMKGTPSFDVLTCDSAENREFGSKDTDFRFFTEFSAAHSSVNAPMAEAAVVKMLNPRDYVDDPAAKTAKFWRIRHGERDRDTSLAISAMLALKLQMAGCEVDYQAPWERPHSGDYDLEELFAWIDRICRE